MTTNLPVSRQQAARELIRRRAARSGMLEFVQYCDASYQAQWYHKLLCEYLVGFVNRDIENLMVYMPPQHGKSQLVSRALPAFIFGLLPDAKVLAASYAAELIQGMNRDVQRMMETSEYQRLFPGSRLNDKNIRTVSGSYLRNNDIFEIVGRKGRYRCAGVGGGLTGFSCDFGIIDDPYKDYKEASSKLVRQGVWEWYTSVFLSRTHNRTGKLLTQTRWHEEDLAGMLLDKEPHKWTVLKLPAICEDPAAPHEIRQVGEALWPERFSVEQLMDRKALSPHQFEALYQQNPSPREGAFFKVLELGFVDAAPAGMREVRAWDIGATEGDGDPTAGVRMGTKGDGKFYVIDVKRGQWGTDNRDKTMRQTAELDGKAVKIRAPQDPGAAGKSLALAFKRLLAGFAIKCLPVSGDKETRADPFSSQVNAGNVFLVEGDWNAAFIEELRQFPNGKDDQVDAAADAFDELNQGKEFKFSIY